MIVRVRVRARESVFAFVCVWGLGDWVVNIRVVIVPRNCGMEAEIKEDVVWCIADVQYVRRNFRMSEDEYTSQHSSPHYTV